MSHTGLMLNDADYEHTKQLIIHEIKSTDLVNPYLSQESATTTIAPLSVSLGSRMFSLKKYLHNVDIKVSTLLSTQPSTINSEIFTFVNVVR